jgi:hypothetical protein
METEVEIERRAERTRNQTIKRRNIVFLIVLTGFALAVFTLTLFHIPQEGKHMPNASSGIQAR